ncbi:7-cyano-7-deazaguanine synthase [Ralstonia solanacearum]|uniref:7-cyano-7-deazaguanine synthase n=1 Tax=Ralstonia solanacearum TaxID=305 RepID=UPI002306263F|nr:7-cyano-7-deazaguanine synthase [Ralstonia solanacearum]MDB0510979.1 7-cyano-7-deazaguanine synthase [Ralstonia solanacearum]MDB0515933.1 7-cyano-7-deazaguanine synthase [Ralstonia solanacearum]
MSDLLLLSGGIDSVAIAAWLRPAICLTVDYGQAAAEAEIRASTQICKELCLQHIVHAVDIRSLGAGDMAEGEVSPHSPHSEFWPYRNQYLITLGAMVAISRGCHRVLVGTVITDKRHADGSTAFRTTIDTLLSLQEGGLRLAAPAADLTSADLIRKSGISIDTLAWSHSCHTGKLACGRCRGCQKHSEVMHELGLER